MSYNRFSMMSSYLANPASRFNTRKTGRYTRAYTDNARCTQVSEEVLPPDAFILDVLEYFFEERLAPQQLNNRLREIAADAAFRATQGADIMNIVPAPPGGQASSGWLGTEAVQRAFRRAQNKCLLETVRPTIKAALRSDYQFAKAMPQQQSYFTRPFTTTNNFTTSDAGVRFIAGFEGFRANLYNDPVGHCTIGYGTLVHRGNCNGSESEEFRNGITEDRARELMRQELGGIESTINSAVTVALSQQQFDALVSFAYNVGTGAFRQSTLLRKLNEGDFAAVPTELNKWVKASGRTLPGLVRRRQAEGNLFSSGSYSGSQSITGAMSNGGFSLMSTYKYENPSTAVIPMSNYVQAQNPGVVAGIALADAIQIGLGAVAIVQSQVANSQGSFSLTYDKAQRLLTAEARGRMPGSQTSKTQYSRRLLFIGTNRPLITMANAEIIIEWEGNPYGEISTPVIRRNLSNSTEWSRSSANVTISKIDRIPLPNSDPRTWPIIYTYEGTYDAAGNGYWEFSGEFEVNAFGGLKFTRHQVVSRSMVEFANAGTPEDYVQKGSDVIVPVPDVPAEQMTFLRASLP